MRIGLVVVGDEVLSGRRTDKHLPKLVEMLTARGLVLSWARVVADDLELQEQTYRETFATEDLVFSTGGIGGTPDDLTREAVARATGRVTVHHPEGLKLVKALCAEYGAELTPDRSRMVEFPEGVTLIPNPVNGIPGFSIDHHHFVPGFPEMAWPMIEWVLDQRYQDLHTSDYREQAVMAYTYESEIIPLMNTLMKDYPGLKAFSLPIIHGDNRHIEFGIKGAAHLVEPAMVDLQRGLDAIGVRWEPHIKESN